MRNTDQLVIGGPEQSTLTWCWVSQNSTAAHVKESHLSSTLETQKVWIKNRVELSLKCVRQRTIFWQSCFNQARIIFYRPSFKWEEGQWQPLDLVYKGKGTHWCKLQVRSDTHSAISPNHQVEKSKTSRAAPPHPLTALPTKHQTSSPNWTCPPMKQITVMPTAT